MNCKPGDLAILISAERNKKVNIGKIYEVLEWVGSYHGFFPDRPGWKCKRMDGSIAEHVADSRLRPLPPPASESAADTVKELENS